MSHAQYAAKNLFWFYFTNDAHYYHAPRARLGKLTGACFYHGADFRIQCPSFLSLFFSLVNLVYAYFYLSSSFSPSLPLRNWEKEADYRQSVNQLVQTIDRVSDLRRSPIVVSPVFLFLGGLQYGGESCALKKLPSGHLQLHCRCLSDCLSDVPFPHCCNCRGLNRGLPYPLPSCLAMRCDAKISERGAANTTITTTTTTTTKPTTANEMRRDPTQLIQNSQKRKNADR